jgi:peptidoglycan/xylan/chitin deacetylase (PgdA/CDA1 family)
MRRIAARLERGHRSLILLYHRIDRPATDPWRLAVSPVHFAEHMEVLRGTGYEPVPLGELARALRAGRPLSRAVAVTFDDGYADNLECGLPVLERHGIPATVYVTAGPEAQAREFWWKQLEALFLEPGLLPHTVQVDGADFSWTWSFNGSSTWTAEQARAHLDWCATDAGPAPSPRHSAFRSLLSALEPMASDRRNVVLAQLHQAAEADVGPRSSHRLMNAEQLRQLTASGLVDVGAHTLTHPHLSALGVDEQRTEIVGSKV